MALPVQTRSVGLPFPLSGLYSTRRSCPGDGHSGPGSATAWGPAPSPTARDAFPTQTHQVTSLKRKNHPAGPLRKQVPHLMVLSSRPWQTLCPPHRARESAVKSVGVASHTSTPQMRWVQAWPAQETPDPGLGSRTRSEPQQDP